MTLIYTILAIHTSIYLDILLPTIGGFKYRLLFEIRSKIYAERNLPTPPKLEFNEEVSVVKINNGLYTILRQSNFIYSMYLNVS